MEMDLIKKEIIRLVKKCDKIKVIKCIYSYVRKIVK